MRTAGPVYVCVCCMCVFDSAYYQHGCATSVNLNRQFKTASRLPPIKWKSSALQWCYSLSIVDKAALMRVFILITDQIVDTSAS